MLNGYGSNFFGYGPEFVREAVNNQMAQGMEIGPQTYLVEEVTELFREFVPMDRVGFCNTGSEAVLAALRMARTATGKDLVVMFEGGYHGMFDEVVIRTGARGKSMPAAPGIPRSAVENMLVLPWADECSFDIIRERADDIAAVIVEPVQSRRPDIQPVDFLRALRDLTQKLDIAYIFDEVVTGFRAAPGGAQERFGIEADIATYGKVIGAGISIGIVAGSRRFLDALDGGAWQYGDDSIPEVGVTYFAGTFVRHPLSLAVSRAALLHMKQQGSELQRGVDEMTSKLVAQLRALFEHEGAPIEVDHFSSVLRIAPKGNQPYGEILFHHLRKHGVHIWAGRPCFLTVAHGDAEIQFIVNAFRESILDLQKGGFYPRPVQRFDRQPVAGAKLGRDSSGNPAWYAPDPNNPDKYQLIKPQGA
jgi:glutamate-1-semialdehyde aminotransferase